ncbi:FYVE, RhoGEF and PH domain-containing protein 6 [Microcaecilia unicolor]|uniref:FYVE, RhoGEF and PH domain-containing protein 6 n=1 Tax=Microcaecilia unicolor TaxID=1415580 RepID=A0A6P7Z535_9AMPH|nr:FYVE, RhoGEF and PH domain-containing protein 6 [Microcaecilia unicolor]
MAIMSAEAKKPPVAPKPKFAMGHKLIPPPIAPKPDLACSSLTPTSKKPKPVIAPKPKVLSSSSVAESRPSPSIGNGIKSLGEHQGNCSVNLDTMNCRNGAPVIGCENPAYIIPTCSCRAECSHKLGNDKARSKTQTGFDQLETLENLENNKLCRHPSPPVETRKKNNPCEKVLGTSPVVSKVNCLEDQVQTISRVDALSNGNHIEHREAANGCYSDKRIDMEFTESDKSLSRSEESRDKGRDSLGKVTESELEKSEVCPGVAEDSNTFSSLGQGSLRNGSTDHAMFPAGDVKTPCPSSAYVVGPSTKALPVPRPRKARAACLIRQDCIETLGEGPNESDSSEANSSEPYSCDLKKFAKIHILGESVSYHEQHLENLDCVSKHENSNHGEQSCIIKVESGAEIRDALTVSSASIPTTSSSLVDNVDFALETDFGLAKSTDKTEEYSNSGAVAKSTSFLRCSSLSMSLPKQLKLTYDQHSPTSDDPDTSAEEKNIEDSIKPNSFPRIIPKKPQRHSLPAAGLLKKSASEELVEKHSYVSSEETSREGNLDRTRFRYLLAKEDVMSSNCDFPKQASEKPVWKLPHPILPFPGSPECLKTASNIEASTIVTKPRAKSLSSVDIERVEKPAKDCPKKSSLKKLLNMKLSVCIMKSDFQRFLSKGSQSVDSGTATGLSSAEGNGISHGFSFTSPAGDRKQKAAKAHSADSSSPTSQKKKTKQRNQLDTPSGQRSGSLDEEQFLSGTKPPEMPLKVNSTPEYENVRHYEEIREYENLPFALASDPCFEWRNTNSVTECDASIYEVQDPCEAMRSCSIYRQGNLYSSPSQDEPGMEPGMVQSDEEEVMNSSDEDDSSSDSSKGDLDHLEDKQSRGAGKKTKAYHIAKEIMSSEKVFVDVLKLLHIDFRDAVAHASGQLGKTVIEDKILNQILYYLPQLYELNRAMLRELEERMAHWNEHQKIADIFVKKGPYLKMYSTYIWEFEKSVALLDEQCKKNPGFAAVVREFEMSPRCASLALKHYLLKPVQRIPQYRLLLTDYLKNLSEESSDYKDTQVALAVVIEVANHANDIMKQGDNFQKLMQIQYSLNGHHEIVQPGRVFLKEGTLMKLSRKVMQPRMFFLFNDALLYTTPVQSGMYKLNNMLSLAGMKVRKPTQEAYQNELNIESVERSFILSASSAVERDEWLEAISRAIEDHTKKKITFNPSKSLEEADPEKEEEDSPLGSKAPIWVPDTRATMCMVCTSEFTLTWRRHHCRACGKIVCQACSANKHSLEYLKNQPARVCDHCFGELKKQDSQFLSKAASPAGHKSPSSALSTVLHSIPSGRKQKKIPAALKEVSASAEDSSMSGYLYRSKGNKKQWKHLWFVIKNKVLYTYAASEDVAALESQPLLGFTVIEVKEESSESRVFQLLHKNTLFYLFKAEDPHTAQKWLEAFQEGTIL